MEALYVTAALGIAILLAWAVRRGKPLALLVAAGLLMIGSILLICCSLSELEGCRLLSGCILGGAGVCLLAAAAFKANRQSKIQK